MLESVDAQAATATVADSVAGRPTQHHLPDLRLSVRFPEEPLPQQRHLFHDQSRHVRRILLPVSLGCPHLHYSSLPLFVLRPMPGVLVEKNLEKKTERERERERKDCDVLGRTVVVAV